MTALLLTQPQVNSIVQEALDAAKLAAVSALNKHGDRDVGGFAWTIIKDVKGNTRLGKMLKNAGVRQSSYDRSFELWNPAQISVQSRYIQEIAAVAAANVFRKHGFNASAGSCLD